MKNITILGLLAIAGFANAISIQASAVAFTDISTTGTSVGTISDDSENTISGTTLSAAGFTGNSLVGFGNSIRVGNNGAILWGTSATDTFTGADQVGWINSTTFGTMSATNVGANGNGNGARQMLAVLWDDTTPGTGGTTRWQVIGGDLYVQWTNQDHFNAAGTGTVTFQAVIRASGPRLIDYVYQDTFYAANAYQNDGGSATIGFKNWGVNALANDVEYGIGGGTNSLADPTFVSGTGMQPKVAGYASNANPNLTRSVSVVPEPATMTALALGLAAIARRRKNA